LKNIFNDNELDEKSVAEEFSVTATDGKNYKTRHYNLDAVSNRCFERGITVRKSSDGLCSSLGKTRRFPAAF